MNTIHRLGISDHVRITGYVNKESYQDYLNVTDVAIQLRMKSRGETSRAVLDCLAFGIPTIINAHGTLSDYKTGEIIQLPEFPQIDDLAQAMVYLRKNEADREEVGKNARNTIDQHHHPQKVAEMYMDVINQTSLVDDRVIFEPLIEVIAHLGRKFSAEYVQSASVIAASNLSLRTQPRILIDVSNISNFDLRTGIQRVVKNLIRGLFLKRDLSLKVELVKNQEGKLLRAARFTEKLFSLPLDSLGSEIPIFVNPGDTLLMLDTSWNLFDQYMPVFRDIRNHGGRIYTMLYDMIPVNFPQFIPESTVQAFKAWIDKAIRESDEIICISKSVRKDVEEYIKHNFSPTSQTCLLSYIHLGADIPTIEEEAIVRQEVRLLVEDKDSPLFLMVGTIEPRKGHAFALDAFERLWQEDNECRLCFLGKIGWNVEALEQRIRNHPELGKRLFFIEKATDAEITLCYSAGTALIAPSIAEGFGLPIVEATLYQVPVIASDIPVFREVGGDGVVYFSLDEPTNLANAVLEILAKSQDERVALAKKVKYLSWNECAAWMLDIFEHNKSGLNID